MPASRRRLPPLGLLALALLPACVMGPPPGAVELPEPYHPMPRGRPLTLERVVRFEHRQVNRSEQPADIELFIAVPRGNERQRVRHVIPSPGYAGEISDDHGNRILHYIDRAVPPGEVVAHGWIAEVAISDYVHDPIAGLSGDAFNSLKWRIMLLGAYPPPRQGDPHPKVATRRTRAVGAVVCLPPAQSRLGIFSRDGRVDVTSRLPPVRTRNADEQPNVSTANLPALLAPVKPEA